MTAQYGLRAVLDAGFEATVERTRAALAEEGFGVLTEIDVAAVMKSKLGIDLPAHLILGACNPPLAHEALAIEPSISLLLPCNVVVRSIDEERTLVEAVDPDVMVAVADQPKLMAVADEARRRLSSALAAIGRTAQVPR
jgi:uncharacterized protein (DUF302 family)